MSFLGLRTNREFKIAMERAKAETRVERMKYYEQVLVHLQRSGSLPPNCDLKLPKLNVVLTNEKGEVVAGEGRWARQPMDGEVLKVTYAKQ